jgi:CBS domain-containing protein
VFNQSKTHTHSRIKSQETKMKSFGPSLDQLYEKDVVCLKASNTVFDAAKEMLENHVGDVVVVEEKNGKTVPVGMVTDRDIVISSIAKKLNPESVLLSEIMANNIVTASEEANLSDLIKCIYDEGVSRLPIVDSSGTLKGVLSSKRLFQYLAQGLCELSSLSVQQQQREEKAH